MKKQQSLLIKNINVVPMTGEAVLPGRWVAIRGGVIESIASGALESGGFDRVVDGDGCWLMPGLINMHTHLGDNADDLILHLAKGITTIRNMWGYEGFSLGQWLMGTRVFDHLALRQRVEDGEIPGPRIVTCGPLLDGDPPVFPRSMPLVVLGERTPVEPVVEGQVRRGYDFLKIYHNLSLPAFDAVMDAARRHGIPVAGHVPDAVGMDHAQQSGLWSAEHLYGFINPYQPQRNPSRDDIRRLSDMAAEKGVWHCPTLVAHERLADGSRREEFEAEEAMGYVSRRNRKGMRFLQSQSVKMVKSRGLKGNHEYWDDLYYVIGELRRAGAGLLLGTDKGVPYVTAGFSEQREMTLLGRAGLSNEEILCTATVEAARCLGLQREIGTVEAGKRADLLITDKNPLDDIGTLQAHRGVVRDGILYDREACAAMLEAVKNRAGR